MLELSRQDMAKLLIDKIENINNSTIANGETLARQGQMLINQDEHLKKLSRDIEAVKVRLDNSASTQEIAKVQEILITLEKEKLSISAFSKIFTGIISVIVSLVVYLYQFLIK